MVLFILSRYGLLAYKPSKNFCVDWKYRKGKKMFCLWLEWLDYTFLSRIMQNISTIRTSYWVETCKSHNFNACEYSFFQVRFWKPLLQLQKSRFINNLHVHYTFLYISLPSVHDYDVKVPNSTFCGGGNNTRKQLFFFFSWTLVYYRPENELLDKLPGHVCESKLFLRIQP